MQDAYSLRCAAQVHGASRDLLDYVERTVAIEINAATDNPLVLLEEREIVSNGNFHGQPVAFALDCLAIAVAELANISERRVERMVNPSLSDGLPAFLTREGGINSGMMILQYVSAALVSENKVLAHPASVDSIPTSAGQEDHVSMGNAAGLKARQVLANAERSLAIELLAGAQAVEFLAPLEPGRGVAAARAHVRTLSERLREDRSLSADIERVADSIRDGSVLAAVEARAGRSSDALLPGRRSAAPTIAQSPPSLPRLGARLRPHGRCARHRRVVTGGPVLAAVVASVSSSSRRHGGGGIFGGGSARARPRPPRQQAGEGGGSRAGQGERTAMAAVRGGDVTEGRKGCRTWTRRSRRSVATSPRCARLAGRSSTPSRGRRRRPCGCC